MKKLPKPIKVWQQSDKETKSLVRGFNLGVRATVQKEREILWEQIFGAVEDIVLTTNRDTLKKDLGIIQRYIRNLK